MTVREGDKGKAVVKKDKGKGKEVRINAVASSSKDPRTQDRPTTINIDDEIIAAIEGGFANKDVAPVVDNADNFGIEKDGEEDGEGDCEDSTSSRY